MAQPKSCRSWRAMNLGLAAALLPAVMVGMGCSEISPTGVVPETPVTVEIRIPWDEFGSNVLTYVGAGAPIDLGVGIVAHQLGDSLEARTLATMGEIPTSATVIDTTGTSVTDTLLHVLGGRIVATIDTLGAVSDGPVTLEAGMIETSWDPTTASWSMGIDSLHGLQTPWDKPGAGPVSHAVTGVWDPSKTTAVFELDSAGVAAWADTAKARGLRLSALTAGSRLEVTDLSIEVDVRPSSNPDTTVVVTASRSALTFAYTPEPSSPRGSIRVGGTPSYRTAMRIELPTVLDGPAELCAVRGCPVELTASALNYAAVVLWSQEVGLAFQPSDSANLDVRPVLDPAALPKAPLGSSLITSSTGKRVAASLFGIDEGTEVDIPITPLARLLLEPDTTARFPTPTTIALVSTYEPVSFSYASFSGPGSARPPELRLIVTITRPIELP
ncbi:MAG TPA: hypothetical protein VLH75_13260 [Longimicrobiales bacterium]|nr:hypothetical protein [Longimicrobiales bacterium]